MSISLALRLKSETRALHVAAERTGFMRTLMSGEMERATYCGLLRNLHAVYDVLEPALARHAAHPMLAPLQQRALARRASLIADLLLLHGPHWEQDLALQPSARSYVARLRMIDADQPELLLAHAYVRYLGDLSGGQMLASVVAASMKVPEGRGTAFYEFGTKVQTQALIQGFRAGLDQVVVDTAGADALVAEAAQAYVLHRNLFDELAHAGDLLRLKAL